MYLSEVSWSVIDGFKSSYLVSFKQFYVALTLLIFSWETFTAIKEMKALCAHILQKLSDALN